MTSPCNVQEEWACTLMDSLVTAGVRDVVLSPGSRSTPFVVAALRHEDLRCHDFIDERVAGFFALGCGRGAGRPALLLCTSGTAPTHYFPAIAEASVSHVPLLVLSADRPPSLFAAGESQTIDQTKLFGTHVRFFADLGAPSQEVLGLCALRRLAAQAVSLTCGPTPGPCHLNARAVRPLEPQGSDDEGARHHREVATRVRRARGPRVYRPRPVVAPEGIEALAVRFRRAHRPLVVAGHTAIDPELGACLGVFAAEVRVPVFAESGSQARFGTHTERLLGQADAIYRSPYARDHLRPDLLVQIGGAPVAKGIEILCAESSLEKIVVAAHGCPDPTSMASMYLQGRPAEALRRLTERLAQRPLDEADPCFDASVRAAEFLARRVRDEADDGCGLPWSEGRIASSVVRAVPSGGLLGLGNSLAIREVDAYADPAPLDLRVVVQRGASGIDGLVSGFAGALSTSATPGVLLLGDVSFLHDAGGVAALKGLGRGCAVVVVNNGGGRIFEQLPIAGSHPELLEHFTTPHEADLSAVAKLYGVRFARAWQASELEAQLAEAVAGERPVIVEAVVAPHHAWEQNRRRFQGVCAALEREAVHAS